MDYFEYWDSPREPVLLKSYYVNILETVVLGNEEPKVCTGLFCGMTQNCPLSALCSLFFI